MGSCKEGVSELKDHDKAKLHVLLGGANSESTETPVFVLLNGKIPVESTKWADFVLLTVTFSTKRM